MKSTILFLVSMFILCSNSCKESSTIVSPDEGSEVQTEKYYGIAIIKLESGDTCKNAMIRVWMLDFTISKEYYADTTGIILCEYLIEKMPGDNNDYPDHVYRKVEAYIEANTNVRQDPWMHFLHSHLTNEYIPINEVIFADSLAVN